jgi:hypothetical protein
MAAATDAQTTSGFDGTGRGTWNGNGLKRSIRPGV